MSDYTFDHKCLQTLALVAWVQQQCETEYSNADLFFKWIYLRASLLDVYYAAQAGDHREYLRLVAGCPPEFKMRVFADNAPADWTVASSRPTNQHWKWRELGR